MTTIQDRIEKLVKDIMQCGFDVAMGGDVFKSEEENKKIQEEKYNECVAVFSHKILSSIKEIQEESKPLIEKCPNCTEQDENIKSMPDGSCGVCGGKGYIEWKKVGKINFTPSSLDEKQKPYRCSTCNGWIGEGGGTCKCSIPSPLEIEEIETLKHRFVSGKNHCWRELSLQDQKINSLIRNQKKLYQLIKEKL